MGPGQGKIELKDVRANMIKASEEMEKKASDAKNSEEVEKEKVADVSLVMELVDDKKRRVG